MGVEADAYYYKYVSAKETYEAVKVGSFVSDTKGYFKMPYLKKEEARNFFVNFKKGNDFNSTQKIDNSYYYYSGSINQYKDYPEHKQLHTFFFLDRAIYRPGQTIYFKGIAG